MAENNFNGFRLEEFQFAERNARLVYPDVKPNGKILFKTEYWGAFPSFEIEMLKKGYYLCNITHRNRWASDDEIDVMADFIKFLAEKLSIEPKCILVGMSCGGLQAARFAEMYPEMTSVMYLDAPVLNILSMAGLGDAEFNEEFWRELVDVYGLNKSNIVNFRKSPIDNMDVLIKNNIPVIMLYGNADNVVIYEENGKVLERFYKENNGIIKVISRSMGKHHPHCLEDPSIIVDFVEKYV